MRVEQLGQSRTPLGASDLAHPLMQSVRRAITGPSSGLGTGLPGNLGGEPPTLSGVVLPKMPTLGGSGGAAAAIPDYFAAGV
jgi:hypothetical protein